MLTICLIRRISTLWSHYPGDPRWRIIMNGNVRVQILNEVSSPPRNNGWCLWFQRVRYVSDDGDMEEGYRFIWRRPDNTLQAARGQARIPSLDIARRLMKDAEMAGWGGYNSDTEDGCFAETKAI
jgi:hypothetical protein